MEGSPKPNSFFGQSLPPETITKNSVFKILLVKLREGSRYQIGKNSKRPSASIPPLIFGKLCCKFFLIDVVAYIRRYDGQIV